VRVACGGKRPWRSFPVLPKTVTQHAGEPEPVATVRPLARCA
jgi:hypothetical protein